MNKEIWKKPARNCNIGGEALIEGVMMRGNGKMAIAVRMADGTIDVETQNSIPITKRYPILGIPFVRGAVSMIDSMITGVKALMSSAEKVDLEVEEGKEDKFDLFMKKYLGENYFQFMLYFSVAIAMVLGIGLFMLLPNFVADFMPFEKETATGAFYANLIEGAMRIVLFISYIMLVSRNKEIKRVFQYHGAEHKTIYAYESIEDLTVENVRAHTTLHPRCGTTFMFVVMFISIILFAFAGWHSRIINMLIRLALLPLVAGVSYEVFKLAAKSDLKILRALSFPGLMLQKITTQEPDDSMIEVAIAALKAVVEPVTEEANQQADVNPSADNTLVADSTGCDA